MLNTTNEQGYVAPSLPQEEAPQEKRKDQRPSYEVAEEPESLLATLPDLKVSQNVAAIQQDPTQPTDQTIEPEQAADSFAETQKKGEKKLHEMKDMKRRKVLQKELIIVASISLLSLTFLVITIGTLIYAESTLLWCN